MNVKPFAPEVGRQHIGIDEAIEMIDVGGAALLGAAARNAAGVTAVCRPESYPVVLEELRSLGQVSADTRYRLAADAYSTVAAYYAEIAAYLNQIAGNVHPQRLALVLEKVADLPYGENPHQRAAFYRETTTGPGRSRTPPAPAASRRRSTCSTSTRPTASRPTTRRRPS
jgi:phosphoribosylaminoimidazolecarboxamide formyltransferase/IMP cyclohydrolase